MNQTPEKTYEYVIFRGTAKEENRLDREIDSFATTTSVSGDVRETDPQIAARLLKIGFVAPDLVKHEGQWKDLRAYEKKSGDGYKNGILMHYARAVAEFPEIDAVFRDNQPINCKLTRAPLRGESKGIVSESFDIQNVRFSDIFHILNGINEGVTNRFQAAALSEDASWTILSYTEGKALNRCKLGSELPKASDVCTQIIEEYIDKFR